MATSKAYFTIAMGPVEPPENTVVLIGTAMGGPVNTPFRLTSIAEPVEILGESPLNDAYEAAQKSGAKDIVLYRLNGTHAQRNIYGDVYDEYLGEMTSTLLLELVAVGAGESYNQIKINIASTTLTAYNHKGELLKEYYYQDYKNLGDLVYAMNIDAEYGALQFYSNCFAENLPSNLLYGVAQGDVYLKDVLTGQSGSDESHLITEREESLDELKDRLLTALYSDSDYDKGNYILNSELSMFDAGIFCLVDMFYDDKKDFDKILGTFCFKKSKEMSQGCLGVLGTKPIQNPTPEKVEAFINDLILMRLNPIKPGVSGGDPLSDGIVLDFGHATWESHLQVVVGETVSHSLNGIDLITIPLAYSYTGTQASLSPEVSATNKEISGFDYLSYELAKEDVDSLLANGYISIISSIRRGFVPYAETTFVTNQKSPFSRPSSLRVVHYVTRRLSASLDTAIGTSSIPMTKRVLMEATQELVASILLPGMVKEYELGFEFKEENGLSMAIKLDITPLQEVKAITSFVKLPFIQGAM